MAQLTTEKSVEPFAHIWDWRGQHLPATLHSAVK